MTTWLELAAGSNVFTPPDGALQITGDIDLRAEITPETWTPAANQAILGRWLTVGGANERSYRMDLLTNGRLRFTWSVNGQTAVANISSTAPVTPPASGRLAVRATLDVNNGAGGRTIRFYTAPSIAGSWTQLGDPVTQGGTTSIHPGTAPLTVGAYNAGASEPFVGRVWAVEVRDGIDGSLVAAADFSQLAEGTTAFTDATGRNWTIAGNASIVAAPVVTGAAESAVTASGEASGLRRVVGVAGSSVATRGIVAKIGDGADVTVTESNGIVSVAEPSPSVLVEEPL